MAPTRTQCLHLVCQDLRLLFRIQKQEFVEHLRSNSEEGRKKALGEPCRGTVLYQPFIGMAVG